eukprot:scaffold1355_cov268-Pinguiococcus_pyrenoidosus.AAC.74
MLCVPRRRAPLPSASTTGAPPELLVCRCHVNRGISWRKVDSSSRLKSFGTHAVLESSGSEKPSRTPCVSSKQNTEGSSSASWYLSKCPISSRFRVTGTCTMSNGASTGVGLLKKICSDPESRTCVEPKSWSDGRTRIVGRSTSPRRRITWSEPVEYAIRSWPRSAIRSLEPDVSALSSVLSLVPCRAAIEGKYAMVSFIASHGFRVYKKLVKPVVASSVKPKEALLAGAFGTCTSNTWKRGLSFTPSRKCMGMRRLLQKLTSRSMPLPVACLRISSTGATAILAAKKSDSRCGADSCVAAIREDLSARRTAEAFLCALVDQTLKVSLWCLIPLLEWIFLSTSRCGRTPLAMTATRRMLGVKSSDAGRRRRLGDLGDVGDIDSAEPALDAPSPAKCVSPQYASAVSIARTSLSLGTSGRSTWNSARLLAGTQPLLGWTTKGGSYSFSSTRPTATRTWTFPWSSVTASNFTSTIRASSTKSLGSRTVHATTASRGPSFTTDIVLAQP